jgi:tetratricopeptide (TPR) repeat protein
MDKRKMCCGVLVLTIVFSLTAVVPSQVIAQTTKGIELYNAGDFKGAERVLRDALKTAPSDAAATYYLGLSILLQNRYKEAADEFLKVKDVSVKASKQSQSSIPSEYQIQVALARARLGLKQYAEAWKNLESATKESSHSSEVYMYRGLYYLQQNKNPEAIKELEKAISLDAKNAYAYYYAGVANDREKHAERAVELLRIFLKLAPNAPEAAEAQSIIDRLC